MLINEPLALPLCGDGRQPHKRMSSCIQPKFQRQSRGISCIIAPRVLSRIRRSQCAQANSASCP